MCRARRQQFQLAGAFDIEEQDAGAKRQVDFVGQLADSGENDLASTLAAASVTRCSSPPETMSNPAPSRASRRKIERFEFAFTE